jgi:hypothetical protein
MIQLNDVDETVINPSHIIFFNVSHNPLKHPGNYYLDGNADVTKRGNKIPIVGKIKCYISHFGWHTFQYGCVDAFKSDYQILLTINLNYRHVKLV